MPRIALGIEYLGTSYCGWQKQDSCLGVQACLEKALAVIACEPIEVFCAGRTDRGVHAMGQVIHFDTSVDRPEEAWVRGANSHLPPDIRVLWREEVGDDFHARFSAVARRYRYVIANRRVKAGVFNAHHAWVPNRLDHESMNRAAQVLVGEHDFTSFRAAECQANHPNRCITHVHVFRTGDFVIMDIEANAFLHHMVRNIIGSLIVVGRGDQPETWIQTLLLARDRKLAAPTADAHGLYLTHVRYPDPWRDFPRMDVETSLWQA